jgi:hypothetical protein
VPAALAGILFLTDSTGVKVDVLILEDLEDLGVLLVFGSEDVSSIVPTRPISRKLEERSL